MFQSRAVWQPSEGSRMWGYLLPMLLVLPIVLTWSSLLLTLGWEEAMLLGGALTFGAVALSWLLYLRTLWSSESPGRWRLNARSSGIPVRTCVQPREAGSSGR